MNKRLNLNKLINNQIKYFTIIIFIITFILFYISNTNIIPLNIIVFIGSIFIFHIYPNIYGVVRKNNKNLIPHLLLYDIIVHYIPLIYILYMNLNETTITNYQLCVIIIILYILILNKEIYNIYFNPEQYFN